MEKVSTSHFVSFEAECSLISCIFYGADTGAWAMNRCRTRKVESKVFTDARNRIIYEIMVDLHDRNLPPTMEMVVEQLKATRQAEKVTPKHLSDCLKMVGSETQTDFFITRLLGMWKLREGHRIAMELLEVLGETVPEAKEFSEAMMPKVAQLSDLLVEENDERLEDVIDRVGEDFELLVSGKEPAGDNLKLGIAEIDAKLTPLNVRRDKYVCLAARPSVGKTSLATQIMQSVLASVKDSVVLDFQLENSRDNHIQQMAARHAQLNLEKKEEWNDGQKELFRKYLAGLKRISEKRLFVYENDMTIEAIKARARWVKKQTGRITLMVIDYIQLVGTEDKKLKGREVVNHVSREIKLLAKELGCPVLVLSQLSREHAKEDKFPQLFDLKESGNIEQDADRVWMLHCSLKQKVDKESGLIKTFLLQRKNKYGRVGRCVLACKRTTTTFFALAKENSEADESEEGGDGEKSD